MRYCAPKALPHSTFLAWDSLDQDKALAFEADQAERCSMCGTLAAEWLAPDGTYAVPPPYAAEPVACPGCREREIVDKALREESTDGGYELHGVTVQLVPVDPALYDPSRFTPWNDEVA